MLEALVGLNSAALVLAVGLQLLVALRSGNPPALPAPISAPECRCVCQYVAPPEVPSVWLVLAVASFGGIFLFLAGVCVGLFVRRPVTENRGEASRGKGIWRGPAAITG